MSAATRGTYLLGAMLVSIVSLCALAAPVTPANAETALTVIEDAYVDETLPSSNFGTANRLKTEGSPRLAIYLKFNVSELPSPPSAALRVFAAADSDTPFEVRTVSDTSWSESTITAANAPAFGPVIAASGPVKTNTWVTLDVSSALTGDGLVTLAVTSASSKAISLHSREGTNQPQLVIPAPPSPSPFVVRRSDTDPSVYVADSASTATSYSGTLKSVVESAVNDLSRAGGGIVHLNAGNYELGNSQFELKDMVGVVFEGEGIDVTTISNNWSISADTEVFDVARATGGGIRDLTVSAGGSLRSTSDAIDYDAGNNQVIERVKVTKSRSRGIVFDGKDLMGGLARGASNNLIRNCVITNVPSDGIKLLAASDNRIEGCTITSVGAYGIQAAKSSPSAGVPNEPARNNVIIGNFIDQAGQDGISIMSGHANQVLSNTVLNSGDKVRDRDGIKIASDDSIACDDNVVSGNTATDNQPTKTQRYGLAIVSPNCHRTQVGGNNFAGNLLGEILDAGTGTIYAPLTPDTEAPSVPEGLTATAAGATQVDLTWSAASDNVAVTGYTVYRDGVAIATVGAATPSFQDTSASPSTIYTYTVDAFDAAKNHSAQSAAASATTPDAPPGPALATFAPSEDAHVSAGSPTSNYGTLTSLRLDSSPVLRAYLKFTVSDVGGTIRRATLRLYSNSVTTIGFTAHAASDTSWSERTITYENAPAVGSTLGSSGSFSSGAYVAVDVTPSVTANGTYTIVLTTTSSAAISLGSRESLNDPQLVLEIDEAPPVPDTEAPSVPDGLTASPVGATQVDLAWNAASDNVAVSGYTIYRDGAPIGTAGAGATSFQDTNAAPSTTYSYTVDAFDAANNHSAQSAPASATTPEPPPPPTLFSFLPSADAQVSASLPSTNYGAGTTLRLDNDPVLRAYLEFTVSGLSGFIGRATLRLHANSSSLVGYDVHTATDSSWLESAITYNNAPAFGAVAASSGPFSSGAYTEVDVTPLISGNGTYTIVLTTIGNTAISLGSRESSNDPQLIVEIDPDPPAPDTEAPSVPGGLAATPAGATQVDLAWNAASDNVGVSGYTIYRDGTAIGTTGGGATSFQDASAAPSTTYSYTVDAFDAANNHSAQSVAASATTPEPPPPPTLFSFLPSADAQVSASLPSTNYGAGTTLRLDNDPVLRAYLEFTVSGVGGVVGRATLRLYANSSATVGYDVHAATDSSWLESTITYNNAPPYGAVAASSGPFTSGAYTEVDVTPLISGNGTYTIVLTTTGNTAVSLGSRESSNSPQLIVATAP